VIPPITDRNSITPYLLSRLQYAPPCNAYYLSVYKEYLTWFVDYEANIEGEPEELHPPLSTYVSNQGMLYLVPRNVDIYFEKKVSLQQNMTRDIMNKKIRALQWLLCYVEDHMGRIVMSPSLGKSLNMVPGTNEVRYPGNLIYPSDPIFDIPEGI
jgi:hypothetical protein